MLDDARKYMEQIRRYVEAGLGTLSPAKARDLARQTVSGEGLSQAGGLARDLLEWSRRNREQITELIRGEIGKQLSAMGLATREDLDALRKRVRALERSGSGEAAPPPRKRVSRAKRADTPISARVPATASRAARPPAARRGAGASASAAKRTTRTSTAAKTRSMPSSSTRRDARASTASKRTSGARSTPSPGSSRRRSAGGGPATPPG